MFDKNCVHINDFEVGTTYDDLKTVDAWQEWSNHYKYVGPVYPVSVDTVIQKLVKMFGVVNLIETRINMYEKGSDKPFHQDRNAHCKGSGNITIGLSLGNPAQLNFKSLDSSVHFSMSQNHGDVFAFTDEINSNFLHGVSFRGSHRISVILWAEIDTTKFVDRVCTFVSRPACGSDCFAL